MANSDIPQRSSQEQFNRQAEHYDASWASWSDELLEWMIKNADPKPGDTVLDVAAGSGFVSMAFAARGCRVVGTDISIAMLHQAKLAAKSKGLEIQLLEAPAEEMPLPDQTFDIVSCRLAPHHFQSVPNFLREAFRVLKQYGTLVIADTSVPGDAALDEWQNRIEKIRDSSHVRNYTADEWRRMTEEAGFTITMLDTMDASISIDMQSWLTKAGCNAQQSDLVIRMLSDANVSIRNQYRIVEHGTNFTFAWQRVALLATKH